MTKYIDADRFRMELEKRLKNVRDYMNGAGMKYKGPKYFKAQGRESAYDALLNTINSLQQEQQDNMIQWTGSNLQEVIDFTGKSPKFGEWFKSWDEFESYVHSHGDILKLFSEDGSHFEVPVGAWIVKTPDGHNVPSVARFIHAKQEQPIKVYRVENEKEQKGLWRKFDGTWEPLFDMLTDGQCKDMPMEDNPIYREGGKQWFASAPSKETLQKWFSKRDLEELTSAGFTISEFEVVGHKKISDFEHIFTRDNIIGRTYLKVSDIYPQEQPEVDMKAKMMKDAVEGIARPDDCEIWVNLLGYGYQFKDGDKVKVIVIKED